MMRRITIFVLFPVALFLLPLNLSYADDAAVLPKGIFKTKMKGKFYFNVDEKFDSGGHTENVAADYNDVLDSRVFPDLSLVEAGFGMPAGSANIGTPTL